MAESAGRMVTRAVTGAIAWLSVAQFFVVEELIQRRSAVPYDRRTNYVSDLGATQCGRYFDRTICSPDHLWMNVSFGLVGAAIILGAVLVRPVVPALAGSPLPWLYAAAGVGAMIVGLFPLDTVRFMHAAGAGIFLVGANLGHLVLGGRLLRRLEPAAGVTLVVLGATGLVGAVLVANASTLGVGVGFVQRIAISSSVVGVLAAGALVLRNRTTP
jgi:hypothetical protein